MSYQNVIEQRKESVENIPEWTWIKTDRGAFDGPKDDWEKSHKHNYFKHLKNRRVVVTAGGNCGMYARLYSDIFDVVVVFEPDPLNFHCLVMNNQKDNVIKINAAVGNRPSFTAIERRTMGNVGMHVVKGPGFIPVMTIDSFNFPILDLLQLDVEGYENFALQGARETIIRCRPIIVVEGDKSDRLLTDMGYRFDCRSGHADRVFLPI